MKRLHTVTVGYTESASTAAGTTSVAGEYVHYRTITFHANRKGVSRVSSFVKRFFASRYPGCPSCLNKALEFDGASRKDADAFIASLLGEAPSLGISRVRVEEPHTP